MVSPEAPLNPAKALEFKEKGNKCFQAGDWKSAETWYEEAIKHDRTNPQLYTNLSQSLLKLQSYQRVIINSSTAIGLTDTHNNSPPPKNPQPHTYPSNMKAYFQLAQAQIALHYSREALTSAKEAHRLCVEEIHKGGKDGSSIGPITELVLRCKGEDWERRERERIYEQESLLSDVLKGLEARRDGEIMQVVENGGKGPVESVEMEYKRRMDEVRSIFQKADVEKARKVPDWCVDDITFGVMVDPVVTKTGQSYDRASIMEHLKRSSTDPLTREPLRQEDLRPNLALRQACEDFLENNGWAVDW